MFVPIRNSCSWILKAIVKQRYLVNQLQIYDTMLQQAKYKTKKMYQ